MLTVTNHTRYKRAARISEIMATTGLGNQVAEKFNKDNQRWSILTDTGVVMIMDSTKDTIITMYRANIKQATAIYRNGRDGQRMPQALYNLIINQ